MKKIIMLIAVLIIIAFSYVVYAQARENKIMGSSEDVPPILEKNIDIFSSSGQICFKLDNYADTWTLGFNRMGQFYEMNGVDLGFKAITGGGASTISDDARLTLIETNADTGNRAIHAVIINKTTLKGTTDFTWLQPDNQILSGPFVNEPFSNVPCSSVGTASKIDKQKSSEDS
jgi:hypothetical protein